MEEKDTLAACNKLIQLIRKDKQIAEQLGIDFEDAPGKRKIPPFSPVRLKKVRIDPSALPSCSFQTTQTRSPDEIALDSGTSTVGAGLGANPPLGSDIVQEESEESENHLDCLEKLLSKDDVDQSESEKDEDESSEDEDELTVLGAAPEANWAPSKKLWEWYLRVSDLELSKEVISEISEEFKASDEVNNHFSPPRFPLPLWSAVQSSSADSFKLKSIFKAQENIFLAIKPLLAAAKNASKDDKSHILKSIQLLCNSNLSLNRLRRCMLAPHLKADLRKSLLAIPVKHNSFFGDDFSKVTDGFIKETSTLEKILVKKTQKGPIPPKGKSSWGSRNDGNKQQPFRGRRKGPYRGGLGKGKNFASNSQPQSAHKSPSGSNPPSSQ